MMRLPTAALLVALAGSLMGCFVLAYFLIDRSISLAYMKQSADSNYSDVLRLEALLENELTGISEGQLMQKLQQASVKLGPFALIKKEDGAIWFNDIPFYIENGRLKKIGVNDSKAGK